jgi:Mrp family chromosome partitioning ATPase
VSRPHPKPPRSSGAPVPFSVVDSARRQALAGHLSPAEELRPDKERTDPRLLRSQRVLWTRLAEECSSALALMGAPTAVGVTSCLRREGRTTVAIAMGLGQSLNFGLATVLVDADLEQPSMAKMMGVNRAPGLAEVLRGEATVESSIQWVGKNLGVLAAGDTGNSASTFVPLLMARDLTAEVEEHCDAVVVDLPPFSGTGVGLARSCPTVVLVVRPGSTPLVHVRKAAAELDRPRVILNGSASEVPRFLRAMFGENR